MRQEIIRKQQEAKEEKIRHEIEKRETDQIEEKRKSLEAEKEKSKAGLTPLISPAALAPPPRFGPRFGPVTNMLAIERAKEKVQQLKAQKLALHQQFLPKPKITPVQTIAQTTAKGAGRIAHTNSMIQVFVLHISFELISTSLIFTVYILNYSDEQTSTASIRAHINQNIV